MTENNHNWDLLLHSIEDNQPHMVKMLLERDPGLAHQTNQYAWNPLHFACRYYRIGSQPQRLQIVRMLCEAGVPVNGWAVEGTSLHFSGAPLDVLSIACLFVDHIIPVALILAEYGADASCWCDPAKYVPVHCVWQTRQAAVKGLCLARASLYRCLRGCVPKDVIKLICQSRALSGPLVWKEFQEGV